MRFWFIVALGCLMASPVFGQFGQGLGVQALLVPRSSGGDPASARTVWALDPFDGRVLNSRVIGPAGSTLTTPSKVVESGRNTYFVSDQVRNAIFEYSMDGVLLRTLVSNIVNPRGLLIYNQQMYVPVGDDPNNPSLGGSVHRYTLDGVPAGLEELPGGGVSPVFSRIPAVADSSEIGGLRPSSPWDLIFHNGQFILSNFHNSRNGNATMPDVYRIDPASGEPTVLVQDATGLSSAQQVFPLANGGFAVAGFNLANGGGVNTTGIYIYDSSGAQQDYLLTSFGPRGIYQLGNGNWLFSTQEGVRVFDVVSRDPAGTLIAGTEGGQFRLISAGFVLTRPVVPEPGMLAVPVAVCGVLLRRARRV